MVLTAKWSNDHGIGIFNWIEVEWVGEFILTFFLLDYSMYIWHRMNHKIPFLWRFHNVHHTDLEMDVTTAIRFHFGENFLFGFLQVSSYFNNRTQCNKCSCL